MIDDQMWWALILSTEEEKACEQWKQQLAQTEMVYEPNLSQLASDNLVIIFNNFLAKSSQKSPLKKELSVLCHFVNGLGNATYKNKKLLNYLDHYVKLNSENQYYLVQDTPVGEHHPWQTIAYAIMAGVDYNEPLSSKGYSLRSLAKNSRIIRGEKTYGGEAGHLLFSLAHLENNEPFENFTFDDELRNIIDIFELARYDHHYNAYIVCAMFHLTEGMCAAAALVKPLQLHQPLAQELLIGQIDRLIAFSLLVNQSLEALLNHSVPDKNSQVAILQNALGLKNDLDSYYFYAGHIIELLCFAASFGYEIPLIYWKAAAHVIGKLNHLLNTNQTNNDFILMINYAAHYRRAITLFAILYNDVVQGRLLRRFSPTQLRQYTANLS